MNTAKFSFEGLKPIEDRIRRLANEIGYLVLQDRTDRKHDETLARFDLNEGDAAPYLADAPDASSDEDESDAGDAETSGDDASGDATDDDSDDADSEVDGDEPSSDAEPSGPLPSGILADAACRWLRDLAERNTVGDDWRRFRVKVWSPKGIRMIDSGQFVCRNHRADLDLPASATPDPDLRIPAPSFDEAATQGAARGIKALGDYYAQWGNIVLGSMGQLQGVNNAMLARLHRQLEESRGQVDQLVAAILENRVKELDVVEQKKLEAKAGDARTELARDALRQLGDAARSFLTARGITPDLADAMSAMTASPDLVAVLKDPNVRALMQDEENLKNLAGMLKATAAQARAAKTSSQEPSAAP